MSSGNGELVLGHDKNIGAYFALRTLKAKNSFKNQMQCCYAVKLFDSDTVCDIGAFIGEYSMYASRFAKQVLSYEASPKTFSVLKMNRKPVMDIFNKAVVGDDATLARLYLSKGIGATNSIVKKNRKAGFVDVPAISYRDAVAISSVVKIDVEGAEYTYPIIQPQLRAIILEFHPLEGRDWKAMAFNIMSDLEASGFKGLKIPGFKNGWDTNSAWVRT